MTTQEFKSMTHAEMEKWIDEQVQAANAWRAERGKPPMGPHDEQSLRSRLRLSVAR